jgi:hypothetical protein
MSEVELEVLSEFLQKLRQQKMEERNQVDEQIGLLTYACCLGCCSVVVVVVCWVVVVRLRLCGVLQTPPVLMILMLIVRVSRTDIGRVGEQLDTLKAKKRERNKQITDNPFSFVRSLNPATAGNQSRKRGRGRGDQVDADAIDEAQPDEAQEDMDQNTGEDDNISIKKRRILGHLDALGTTYFEARKSNAQLPLQQFTERLSAVCTTTTTTTPYTALHCIAMSTHLSCSLMTLCLSLQFTRFDNLRPLCTFLYSSLSAPLYRPQQTPIVSSIAFNSDEDFFAVAGVCVAYWQRLARIQINTVHE